MYIKIYLKDKTFISKNELFDRELIFNITNYTGNMFNFILTECSVIKFAIPTFKSKVKESDNYIYINHYDVSLKDLYNDYNNISDYLRKIKFIS